MKNITITILLVIFAAAPGWAQETKTAHAIVPTEGVILPNPGKGFGRVPIHQDPVELELVQGRWQAPKAGDQVKSAGGAMLTWEKVALGKEGQIQHKALFGGYLYVPIEAEK